MDGAAAVPEVLALNDAVNRVLDVSDAFVRESSAALTSAAEGRFHRRLLLTGLSGAFRKSAKDINAARDAMQETAGRVTEAQTSRLRLADEFESVVLAMSEQVGTTVTEMNALVDGIAAAVDGSASLNAGATDTTGLSQMAERLRSEAIGFLAEMRR